MEPESMSVWRRERADAAIRRHLPECPFWLASEVEAVVVDRRISPSEFEALLAMGCEPRLAVEILA